MAQRIVSLEPFHRSRHVVFWSELEAADEVNTLVQPFHVLRDGQVRFVAADWSEAAMWEMFERTVTVVEVIGGAWLSQIVSSLAASRGREVTGVDVMYIGPALGDYLRRHGVVRGSHLPDYFNSAASVPAGYDHGDFERDAIFPGQRFLILWPDRDVELAVAAEGDEVDRLWLGFLGGAQADAATVGYSAMVGAIFYIGPGDHWYGLRVTSPKFGLGLGASTSVSIVLAWGYDEGELEKVISGDREYVFDFTIAVGAKWGKLAKNVKNFDKLMDAAKKFRGGRKAGEFIAKNADELEGIVVETIKVASNGKPADKGILVVALPIAPGLHLHAGYKKDQWRSAYRELVPELD